MTPTIRIEVAMAPALVLEQLARYGKDWHESRLPPEVRGRNLWLKVDGSSFQLQLPSLYGETVVWRGSVVDAGAGSVVTAEPERERGFMIGPLLGVLFAAGYGVVRGAGRAFVIAWLALALLLQFLLPRLWARRAKRETPLCRAILLRAMQVPVSSTDSGAV